MRFASGISFIPLFFYKHYPVRFRPWLMLYGYLWLTFTLPVIFTFLIMSGYGAFESVGILHHREMRLTRPTRLPE